MFLNSAKRTRNDCLARPFRKGYGVFHVCPVLARRPCNSALPLRGPVVSFMASEAVRERLPAFGYRPPAESEAQKPEKGARLTGSEPYTVSCFQGTYRQPLKDFRTPERNRNYFSSTSAPASSSWAFSDSASSFETPSFTAFGAPSTRSLASFRPRPVSSLTTFTTCSLA